MLNDYFHKIYDFFKRVLSSRIFALALVFTGMFLVLAAKLFELQIVNGEAYLEDYVQMIEKTVTTPGTRGNIYDRNGNLLAYNELAYAVTVQDTGDYPRSAGMNDMLLRLVRILNKHGYEAQGKLEIALNDDGEMIYTSSSEAARKRFLRDFYGRKSVDELDDEKGKYPTAVTARELIEKKKSSYGLDKMKDEKGNPLILSDAELVQLVNIRYTMSLVAYKKYEATTICDRVDDETVADLMEHTAELKGVEVAETTIRRYNDAEYFAPIIGYTGKVQEDQLEELKKTNPEYELSDIVGRTGIEASMELELQGHKGYKNLVVNNVGNVMQVVSETQASTGNDIYLTIDRDLQIGIYHLIEQQLAGIITNKLVNRDLEETDYKKGSNIPIPVKDVYFQLINNNVLSIDNFASEEASDVEQQIYQKYESSRVRIEQELRGELQSENATPMNALSEEMQAYMQYIYSYLSSSNKAIVQRDAIDTSSDMYQAWKNGTISLREYLYYGIANNWIDTTKLDIQSRYSNADDVFTALLDDCFRDLEQDPAFEKLIYQYLINNNVVTGRELCMALYSQNVLAYDENEVNLLRVSGEEYAYQFLMNKIRNIEITPAQLALDPCTASCVVTSAKTGEVLALVSYPSYDNNRISDSTYFAQLNADQSLPLRNNATQTLKAPGSTFKPITAIAGLEEGAITLSDMINCTGIYEEVSNPIRCWKYPGFHGPLNVVGGIENSCNYFFSEVAHRLSTETDGSYKPEKGLETLKKYATMFGLDRTSGIEISEATPSISDTDPERSSMGQGTHQFASVQLARYVTALANRGTVYDLSLIDKETDSQGNLVKDYSPAVASTLDFQTSTWDAVQQGMRQVVTNSSTKRVFDGLDVHVAGKTGTAQESQKRGNHAFFISFAPYENPEISVTVSIPNGYSSSNAAMVAKHVYRYFYGYASLDDILNSGALDASNERINGD